MGLNFALLKRAEFIIDDPDVPRRRSRILEYGRFRSNVYVIPIGMDVQKTKDRLKKTARIRDTQFLHVKDLYDPANLRDKPVRTKLSEKKAKIKAGSLWGVKNRSRITMPFSFPGSDLEDCRLGLSKRELDDLGLDAVDTAVWLTEKEYEKVQPPKDQEVGVAVLKKLADKYGDHVFNHDVAVSTYSLISRRAISWEAGDLLVRHTGVRADMDVEQPSYTVAKLLHESSVVAQDKVDKAAEDRYNEIASKYPRMIKTGSFNLLDYVREQDSNTNTEEVSS